MKKFSIPCIIFAGGKSSRMGKDKSLLLFGDKPLIQYQYERLSLMFEKVYISSKSDKFDFKAPLILDSSKVYAPTPAFLDIFEKVYEFFALSVDTPFINQTVIEKLITEAKKHPHKDAIIAQTDFPHPLIGIYRKSIAPKIEETIKKQNYKLNAILKEADTQFVEFKEDERFLNLNYPQDFQKALQLKKVLL
ncbi:molybdenum cofactor guanylyltransferase MobA [Nitratiruptor tergarcus]|uniref:Probable molybdenum cofactor guanylyltransferase n=1 Tax=Nitratiruptor tergarcus DSM 16512 TaxID=1069081 RepID=A0A1W1WQP5_9BACT|nr:molybdenum cofactor guanylyltransferase MobA [Nitratiruptor tergarcus]SMC08532.1 molybdopterin-guanine dinucleotide biosynthesis protein A [Nitratiruptor tergarcus DSM 16512]